MSSLWSQTNEIPKHVSILKIRRRETKDHDGERKKRLKRFAEKDNFKVKKKRNLTHFNYYVTNSNTVN